MLRTLSIATAAATLVACVTINVYFPAVAAEKAADRIINDVWKGQPPQQQPASPGQTPPEKQQQPQSRRDGSAITPTVLARAVLDAAVPAAHAQSSPNIDVSSPAIRKLTASMEQRFTQLRPYYDSGAVGLTHDALVTVRDLGAVPLAKRNRVRQLVDAENQDRKALYREIARANGHPEWEQKIREVFARRWIANAKSGWYYQNDGGKWVRK